MDSLLGTQKSAQRAIRAALISVNNPRNGGSVSCRVEESAVLGAVKALIDATDDLDADAARFAQVMRLRVEVVPVV
jgi:hypothetical protein